MNADFTIPPLFDAKAINIYPHMHLLGRQIKVDVVAPGQNRAADGLRRQLGLPLAGLLHVYLRMPLKAGTTVALTCTFDNSDNNPNNPNNPLVPVSWGEKTRTRCASRWWESLSTTRR